MGGGYGHPFPLVDGAAVWGMNNIIFNRFSGECDFYTDWFDLHAKEWILEKRPQCYEWYKKQIKPIWLAELDHEIKNSRMFPFDFYITHFKTLRFAGSIDWMFAKAIHEEFEIISLHWFQMTTHDKNTASYWIGRAEERGILIIMEPDCGLRVPDLYRK